MKLMVLDGNSIINRAFYGVRVAYDQGAALFTNAIYGFLNILEKLRKEEAAGRAVRRVRPQGADVPPSGRIDGYKAHAPSDAGGAGHADAVS